MTPPFDLVGRSLAGGRYTVVARLGEGGMATVYKASDRNLGAEVVIKIPLPTLAADPEFCRRFRAEVGSLVRLSDPHIVKVTDLGDLDGVPFAVMQYLPGGTLDDRLARGGLAMLAALPDWLRSVASALDHVHALGFAHRDVKPGNILFDAQGNAFLGDFGVVKAVSERAQAAGGDAAKTSTGLVVGTPEYMAPELILGDPFDGRVDQYALAITVYQALCGRRPFEHEVKTRVLLQQANDPPPGPSRFRPWIPQPLEAALLRGLAKDPAARFPSCSTFASSVIAATGVEAGAFRLRCGHCGRMLKVPPAALPRLERKPSPCPACHGLIDLTTGSAAIVVPGTPGSGSTGGTKLLPIPDTSTEHPVARPSAAPRPATPAAGTIVLGNTPSGHGATVILGNAPGNSSGTVIVGGAPGGSGGTVLLGGDAARAPSSGTVILPGGPGALPGSGHAPAPASDGSKSNLVAWFVMGGGVVAILGALGLYQFALRPAPTPELAASKTTPAPPPPPSEKPPAAETRPAVEKKAPAKARPLEPPVEPKESKPDTIAKIEPAEPPAAKVSDSAKVEPIETRAERPAPDDRLARTPSRPAPDYRPAPDSRKPDMLNVALAKILAAPAAHAGNVLTLERVYNTSRTAQRSEDGAITLDLLLHVNPNPGKKVGVAEKATTTTLVVHPDLAQRLVDEDFLDGIEENASPPRAWTDLPANVTVEVAEDGVEIRVVRLEFLEEVQADVNAVGNLNVDFTTRLVSPGASRIIAGDRANDDIWRKKVQYVYNYYKSLHDAMRNRRTETRFASLNRANSAIIGAATQAGISQQAANESAAASRLRGR